MLTFVTGNPNKAKEVMAILGGKIEVVNLSLDLEEIQHEDPVEISRKKCIQASLAVKGPVIVEDTCLCFKSYKGLPGPFVKYFLKAVGPEGLKKMCDGFGNYEAYAQCTFSYRESLTSEVLVFIGTIDENNVRGPETFGWDCVFEPLGHTQTFAEMSKQVKNEISHRSRALEKLKEFFQV